MMIIIGIRIVLIPRIRVSHDRSLGNRPGLANLWSLNEANGMIVSIDSSIAIDHLISSQSNGEYTERFIDAAPKGSESNQRLIRESDP
tara:strand:+ start:1277 stop:1540 length:264 start_codon:yes stop_codon:yes gene_type:complete